MSFLASQLANLQKDLVKKVQQVSPTVQGKVTYIPPSTSTKSVVSDDEGNIKISIAPKPTIEKIPATAYNQILQGKNTLIDDNTNDLKIIKTSDSTQPPKQTFTVDTGEDLKNVDIPSSIIPKSVDSVKTKITTTQVSDAIKKMTPSQLQSASNAIKADIKKIEDSKIVENLNMKNMDYKKYAIFAVIALLLYFAYKKWK